MSAWRGVAPHDSESLLSLSSPLSSHPSSTPSLSLSLSLFSSPPSFLSLSGVEFLDTITPQYIADLVVWGAIGARTTESQVHRQLASGMSCAIGFKNGTGGNVKVSVDACQSSSMPHSFLSVTKDGVAAAVHTAGNSDCHIILRGGSDGPNYFAANVAAAAEKMTKSGQQPRIIIDCSHGNSLKDHKRQMNVVEDICTQIASGTTAIRGVMIESHLHEGKQTLKPGITNLVHLKRGVSVTDACVNVDETAVMLQKLASGVKARRAFGLSELLQ